MYMYMYPSARSSRKPKGKMAAFDNPVNFGDEGPTQLMSPLDTTSLTRRRFRWGAGSCASLALSPSTQLTQLSR